ncbi:MAG: hypothetical protein COA99_08960 [Moraxellaceae bacterium]|nr:MAG: hypothetical protein COA99_08960 [Moraxellaceae bacterium]
MIKNDQVDLNTAPLARIFALKQRQYTLAILGLMFVVSIVVTVVAFIQGIFIRQIINSSVLVITAVCIVALLRSQIHIVWPSYVTVIFFHLMATNGLFSNGGISTYAASILPVLPIISALLLGKRAAYVSFLYALLVATISGGLWIYGMHPENITPLEDQPLFALLVLFITITCAFGAFYDFMAATTRSEEQIKQYSIMLEDEVDRRLKAEQQVKNAMNAKSRFLSTISHELRTPLNSIIGFNNRLINQELTERGNACTEQIRISSDVLLNKIDDLLAFTEISFGKSQINKKTFVINDLFLALKNEFSERYIDNNNNLSFQFDGVECETCDGDVKKIQRAIHNLIDNGLKYTKNGEVIVTVKCIRDTDVGNDIATNRLIINVKDNGMGIPKAKMEQLFDAFTQVDMSTSRSYEGIGLGLASSYHLACLFGGSLEVKPNLDKGTTFVLSIPITIN